MNKLKERIKYWINEYNAKAVKAHRNKDYELEEKCYVKNDILRKVFFWCYK